jgi:hypothetical protein
MTAKRKAIMASPAESESQDKSDKPERIAITEEDSLREFERQYYLRSHLEGIACLPESLWLQMAMEIPMHRPTLEFSGDEIKWGLETYWGNMHAQRYRYGRAVQPTKPLHDLAPVVGAVAIEFRTRKSPKNLSQELSFEYARCYMNDKVLAGIASGDSKAIQKIAEFAEADICGHVNYLVWEAYWSCVEINTEVIGTSDSGNAIVHCVLPATKEIKEFVRASKHNMYRALSNLDDPGWSKVFRQSGLRQIIQSSTKKTARGNTSEPGNPCRFPTKAANALPRRSVGFHRPYGTTKQHNTKGLHAR